MFSKLKNIFKPSFSLIENMERNRVRNHPDMLDRILNHKSDALIVHNFLDEKLCTQAVNSLNKFSENLKTEIPFGSLYGKTLVGSAGSMKEYFEKANLLNEQATSVLGFNLLSELNHLFCDRIEVEPCKLMDGTYTHGTVRNFKPNKGGLHAHAEAEFVQTLAEFSSIKKQVDVTTQINYLLILQGADSGGELVLYDLKWNDTPPELKAQDTFYDHYAHREPYIQRYAQQSIPLKTGDLLLFNGINIWHAVKEIEGSTDRITYAGFLAKRSDNNSYIAYN